MFCSVSALLVLPHEEHPFLYKENEAPWKAQMQDFHKLLRTDVEAARSELQDVAIELFGEHILTQEWIPLYFRISKDGTTFLRSSDPNKYAMQIQQDHEVIEHYKVFASDLKRVSELEVRMLKSSDPKKYVKQMRYHNEAIEHYKALENTLSNRLTQLEEKTTDISENRRTIEGQTYETLVITDQERVEKISRHISEFVQLLPKNPKAARASLDQYAKLLYNNHPLTEEWKKLFFRHCRAKKATILELIRVQELEKQMLTDIDAKKHAKVISNLELSIKHYKLQQKSYEQQGKPNAKESFEFSVDVDPKVFKK